MTAPTIVRDLPDSDYHADKTSLSSSGARLLLQSPAKFRWQQTHPRKPKDVFDFGHAVHTLVLGMGASIQVCDFDSWATKAAKETKTQARLDGKTPLLREQYEDAKAAADAVLTDPDAGPLFAQGEPELSAYWDDPDTGVRLRLRPDWLIPHVPLIVDLKTTQAAPPDLFTKSVASYGYFQQAAFYIDGAQAAGLVGEEPRFLFVAVEKEGPYLVSVTELHPADIDKGRALNRAAIDLFAECQATDTWPKWPGDTGGIYTLTLPLWI